MGNYRQKEEDLENHIHIHIHITDNNSNKEEGAVRDKVMERRKQIKRPLYDVIQKVERRCFLQTNTRWLREGMQTQHFSHNVSNQEEKFHFRNVV